jgi:hypothetical protein
MTIIQLGLFFCGFSGCPLRLELPINDIIWKLGLIDDAGIVP